jgi:hypothetical protein
MRAQRVLGREKRTQVIHASVKISKLGEAALIV